MIQITAEEKNRFWFGQALPQIYVRVRAHRNQAHSLRNSLLCAFKIAAAFII